VTRLVPRLELSESRCCRSSVALPIVSAGILHAPLSVAVTAFAPDDKDHIFSAADQELVVMYVF
jgi:O-acetyl-ADP-ribose deacetylase (regulator of RNase III)